MSDESTLDMVRWTFTANPEHRAELEAYLIDHGADVHIKNEANFIVLWDEPEFDMDQVVEALWTTNDGEFQVIHEGFHRLNLISYEFNVDDDDDDDDEEEGEDEDDDGEPLM